MTFIGPGEERKGLPGEIEGRPAINGLQACAAVSGERKGWGDDLRPGVGEGRRREVVEGLGRPRDTGRRGGPGWRRTGGARHPCVRPWSFWRLEVEEAGRLGRFGPVGGEERRGRWQPKEKREAGPAQEKEGEKGKWAGWWKGPIRLKKERGGGGPREKRRGDGPAQGKREGEGDGPADRPIRLEEGRKGREEGFRPKERKERWRVFENLNRVEVFKIQFKFF